MSTRIRCVNAPPSRTGTTLSSPSEFAHHTPPPARSRGRIGEFFGQPYFCDPRGQMLAVGKRDDDDIVLADLDLDLIREVRHTWQVLRDRRPETYGPVTEP